MHERRRSDTYGRLDILFNNAGSGVREIFPDESDESWDRVIRSNLTDTLHRYKPLFDRVQMLEGTGHPIDVANAALFLASQDSPFITGEFIHVDGGMPMKLREVGVIRSFGP
ncbi:MAG: SDR family oxidoreductase [Candidatus Eisenbacteria bacterium]